MGAAGTFRSRWESAFLALTGRHGALAAIGITTSDSAAGDGDENKEN